jgi:ligand-binding sensor protein
LNKYDDIDEEQLHNFQKYHYVSRLDLYLDELIVEIGDEFLVDPEIEYAVLVDKNGYIPSHNTRYTRPLTGDFIYDRDNNRTKCICIDEVGITAAGNTNQKYLLQVYTRKDGEKMWDVSFPVFVEGEHWGAFRIGFSIARTEKAIFDLSVYLSVTMFLLILLIVILINRITAFMMKPLTHLHDGVKSLSEGNLNVKLKP